MKLPKILFPTQTNPSIKKLTIKHKQSSPYSHQRSQILFAQARNYKSMKLLKTQLDNYQSEPKRRRKILSQIKLKEPQYTNQINLQNVQQMSDKLFETYSVIADIFISVTDRIFINKSAEIVDSLILNLQIFKKVFEISKKKRSMIERISGWDPIFNPVFFNKVGDHFSQQFKIGITKQTVIRELGLNVRNFESKNIYNKLRLFVAELISSNINQQKLQSDTHQHKLGESCAKLKRRLDKLIDDPRLRMKNSQQLQNMKQTQLHILNMKLKIKNKNQDLQKLSRLTGELNINPFYLREQKNVNFIESSLINAIKS